MAEYVLRTSHSSLHQDLSYQICDAQDVRELCVVFRRQITSSCGEACGAACSASCGEACGASTRLVKYLFFFRIIVMISIKTIDIYAHARIHHTNASR